MYKFLAVSETDELAKPQQLDSLGIQVLLEGCDGIESEIVI